MSQEFINEFITTCIQNGKTSPIDICAVAKEEILSLDQEMKKIEDLRVRQSNLRAVVRQLGGTEVNKRAKRAPIIVDSQLKENELDQYIREMCVKICDYIESQYPKQLKPREIMDAVSSLEENKAVLTAIKWLHDNSIIDRREDSFSREILKGKDWDLRPKNLEE